MVWKRRIIATSWLVSCTPAPDTDAPARDLAPGLVAPPERFGDADGDGHLAAEGCDDADPSVWNADAVHVGDLVLDDDDDGATLCADHGACALRVEGSVLVDDATTLSGLACVTTITGDLLVQENPDLPDLTGLERLESVDGEVVFTGNRLLVDLIGLGSLTTVGGDLVLEVTALEHLVDLEALTTLGGTLDARRNGSLVSLAGLGGLTGVGGVYLEGHANLGDVGGRRAWPPSRAIWRSATTRGSRQWGASSGSPLSVASCASRAAPPCGRWSGSRG